MKLGTNDIGSVYLGTNAVQKVYLGTNEVWSSYAYLLDDYSGASAAYSLRKLSSTYSGDAIKVRRASDNTEQNIGFVNNELDTSTLATFCSGTNGFVTTWYDQSGNGNNALQTTAASQPQIVSSGSVLLEGGKPTILFDGSNDFFSEVNGIMGTSVNGILISVHKTNNNTTTPDCTQIGNPSPVAIPISGNNVVSYAHLCNVRIIVSTAQNFYNRRLLVTRQNYNSDMALYINSVTIGTSTEAVTYTTDLKIGRVKSGAGFLYFNNNLQEIICYPNNQTTNRALIESNINTYYAIY